MCCHGETAVREKDRWRQWGGDKEIKDANLFPYKSHLKFNISRMNDIVHT